MIKQKLVNVMFSCGHVIDINVELKAEDNFNEEQARAFFNTKRCYKCLGDSFEQEHNIPELKAIKSSQLSNAKTIRQKHLTNMLEKIADARTFGGDVAGMESVFNTIKQVSDARWWVKHANYSLNKMFAYKYGFRNCEGCGRPFPPRLVNQKFCSKYCRPVYQPGGLKTVSWQDESASPE